MKSIYYYWYAKKRLAALKKDLLTMGDDNPMLEAQGDMIELEISYYKEERSPRPLLPKPARAIRGGLLLPDLLP